MTRRRIIIEEHEGCNRDEIDGIMITHELIFGFLDGPDRQIRYLLNKEEIEKSCLSIDALIGQKVHELIKTMDDDICYERRTKS